MSRMSAEEFNQQYPIGTHVTYFPVTGRLSGESRTTTRSKAWTLESGQVLVLIEGKTGGVHIDNVVVVK